MGRVVSAWMSGLVTVVFLRTHNVLPRLKLSRCLDRAVGRAPSALVLHVIAAVEERSLELFALLARHTVCRVPHDGALLVADELEPAPIRSIDVVGRVLIPKRVYGRIPFAFRACVHWLELVCSIHG